VAISLEDRLITLTA